MSKKKILIICGSINQTTMMHKISKHLESHYDITFSSYYGDQFLIKFAMSIRLLKTSIFDGQFRARTEQYLHNNGLKIDYMGSKGDYDFVITCNDIVIPNNIRGRPIVLVQEGMTDPPNMLYKICRATGLPLYISACTAAFGKSDLYTKFCVASEGYKVFFANEGVKPEKMIVTGIPNWDNCQELLKNDFPHKGYVLVATSDMRETFKKDDRPEFLKRCKEIAGDKQIIFKLHPNEKAERATREIHDACPGSLIFTEGNTDHMIANCDILITQYSTVVYVGLALGKECHSFFDMDEIKKLVPWQNGGTSAERIANVCRELFV